MPEFRTPPASSKLATALMAALLLIGLYAPTSHGAVISTGLYMLTGAALLCILCILLLRRRGVLSVPAVVNAVAINIILLLCTLFSPFTDFAYGEYVPIMLLSALFCVGVRDIAPTVDMRRLFILVNVLNIVFAVLLFLQVPAAVQFVLDNYAFGYEDLVPYMLAEGKPVLMFGSHSLAGFFFYLFFYMTFHTFLATGSRLHLVFAISYLALLASLYSFTALVFAALAATQMIWHFQWRKPVAAGLAAAMLLLGAIAIMPRLESLANLREDLAAVMNREDNGLLGRYSEFGGLSTNMEYIAEHPFHPIGMGYSSQLWYADSGPVEYLLKGSFPLLLAVYGGAFLFFYKNLKSRSRAVFLFLVFLGFEIGYSNLQYLRTQCLLPLVLVYLNELDGSKLAPRSMNA